MFHEISSWAVGKISDMKVQYEETERLTKIINSMIKERTKIENPETVLEKDMYMSSEEALKLNIIDEIL